jgi:uncharacterized protein (TIGR02466 family)
MTAEWRTTSRIVWATPILSIEVDDATQLNRDLALAILSRESRILAGKATPVAGLTDGMTTHWMEYNVLNWEEPVCAQFRSIVLRSVREYFALLGNPDDPKFAIAGISCWANILRFGQSLEIHHHDPGFISAHYMVQAAAPEGDRSDGARSGYTTYFRPGFIERTMGGDKAGPTSPWDGEWQLSEPPRPGRLVFFPSYVRHEVRPNLSQTPRISIAMDVYLRSQQASKMLFFSPPRWFRPADA